MEYWEKHLDLKRRPEKIEWEALLIALLTKYYKDNESKEDNTGRSHTHNAQKCIYGTGVKT